MKAPTFDIPTRQETIELVACPRCGATKNEPCKRGENTKKKDPGNHRERLKAARDLVRDLKMSESF